MNSHSETKKPTKSNKKSTQKKTVRIQRNQSPSNSISPDKIKSSEQSRSSKNVDKITTNGSNKNKSQQIKPGKNSKKSLSNMNAPPTVNDPPIKLERSNSFSLTRGLSKLIHSITGSKENIAKETAEETPYKFTRSRSMILLRRTNRRSVIEPQLEQLSEETEKPEEKSPEEKKPEFEFVKPAPLENGISPQAAFQKRRSSTFIASLKRTFTSTNDKKPTLNPKWSASLQSLQAIDNMVSYKDMKFIDYDKFNTYERNLELRLSQQNLQKPTIDAHSEIVVPSTSDVSSVVRRRKKTILSKSRPSVHRLHSSTSLGFEGNFEQNLDKRKNLYRASLDSSRLERLNDIARDSFIWDIKQSSSVSSLNIKKVSREQSFNRRRKSMSDLSEIPISLISDGADVVDGPFVNKLKSRSLTHLDCINGINNQSAGSTKFQNPLHLDVSLSQKPSNHIVGDVLPQQLSEQRQQCHFQMYLPSTTQQQTINQSPSTSSSILTTSNTICCADNSSRHNGLAGNSNPNTALSCSPRMAVTNLSPSSIAAGSIPHGATAIASCSSTLEVPKSISFTKKIPINQKKPLLTRSEISSSEYFSVQFCTENSIEEELIPATKGVTLSESLETALRRRNLRFSQISITDNNSDSLLEPGTSSQSRGLDENTDAETLSGKLLIIVEKDERNRRSLQKASSFGARPRLPIRLLSSVSTEDSAESEQKHTKHLKQRWSGLFGIRNPQQLQLCDMLNTFAKNGIPQRSKTPFNFNYPEMEDAIDYLNNVHSSWQEFVKFEGMSDHEIKIQTGIWELVTTEIDYIHAIQTVTDLFLACLEAIQYDKLLTDVDQSRLFSNICDICEANLSFWALYLYPMVAHSIATGHPLCIEFFQRGFTSFSSIFAPYEKYCAEQSTCQFYCKELNGTNPLFTAYLAWCESQKMCNRLRLADILVRPMQRLTKYSLLLMAIRKHIVDEDEGDLIDSMIQSVENFVISVNTHLTARQENERLKGVMARIESYDVVEGNNEQMDLLIRQHSGMFDLCEAMKGCPPNQGRHLFMEGDLKLKDNQGKLDVHCFVLTDILLICKAVTKKSQGMLRVIRPPYFTERIVVSRQNNTILNCIYLNELDVVVSAFTLQCAEAKSWHDSIIRARNAYNRLRYIPHWENYKFSRYGGPSTSAGNAECSGVDRSPAHNLSHVSSSNNSHTGSVEWNDSRNISIECEKPNSLSSDDGSLMMVKQNTFATSPHKQKVITSSNTLTVQPSHHLGQSLPNLNQTQSGSNTLLVPGHTASSHSGILLSPTHRGISYPPPSPTRATLRRGFAFSSSIKNPPLLKTRNITSQNSVNCYQMPGPSSTISAPTPTPTHSPTPTPHTSRILPSINSPSTSNNLPSTSTSHVRQVSNETDV